MELGGTEKRIQALFSELALEDRSRMPRFERVWTRAESTPERVTQWFRVAVAVAIVIAATGSFALWPRFQSIASQSTLIIAPLEIPVPALPQLAAVEPSSSQPERQKTTRVRRAERSTAGDVAQLSRWQSPTQTLIESPTSTLVNSLPQLNQSAKELESFLPKNIELKKESNR